MFTPLPASPARVSRSWEETAQGQESTIFDSVDIWQEHRAGRQENKDTPKRARIPPLKELPQNTPAPREEKACQAVFKNLQSELTLSPGDLC